MSKLLDESQVASLGDLRDAGTETRLRQAILRSSAASQRINSQVMMNADGAESLSPPALFQLLGQRFAVDSYALSQLTYDRLLNTDEHGQHRWMPCALDALAALGNADARGLLSGDLRRWHYAPQLAEAERFTTAYLASKDGQRSVYDLWLSALTTLQADMSSAKNFPAAMRTPAWRLKQLQTQLASWAELRHDGILYVKQSYTHEECDYPAAFVEPCPELYARLALIANRLGDLVATLPAGFDAAQLPQKFWLQFAQTMLRLERLARSELDGKPFAAEDERFLKDTIQVREWHGDCGGGRDYTGWYCGLLYPKPDGIDSLKSTVADFHTDPNEHQVLEAGVGRANLAVVAINSGGDHMAFVGPVYTYYEFTEPVTSRMTDEQFQARLLNGPEPARPQWIRAFEPTAH